MNTRLAIFLISVMTIAVTLAGGSSMEALEAGVVQDSAVAVRTTADGVYTEEQAFRGEEVYFERCDGCHNNGGRRRLTNDAFLDHWRGDELDALFRYVSTEMPNDIPGFLSEENYLDVLAYVLWGLGLPEGTEELTADSVANILFVGEDGPQPFPDASMIQIVGCLEVSNDTWMLTQVNGLNRIWRAVEPTPLGALQAVALDPLGTATYELRSLSDPESHAGHKMQVKGVFTRRSGDVYVEVLQLEHVDPTCAG